MAEFDHAQVAFGAVVVGWDPGVAGEAQVVGGPVDEPVGQGVASGVERCAVSLVPMWAACW
ncbi:hypothetical protein BCD48_44705 [Pseudofrankia sp. BMG5.36]|nr:hypothetical protein BCD48_44705 [Pseudofrankia sp. BMG5.36]